ncbi:MAG: hypothetical protein IT258_00190 [Saprospiraceae bacterium]|nr:hypothetical protein [Saprospiraceae bacterium]
MGKKLQPKELERIISILPKKEQIILKAQEDLSAEWLEEKIAYFKKLIQRDIWFGGVWFVAYTAALFLTKFSQITVYIFLMGMAYFIYTIFKTGSFGLNKNRVKVYEELLKAIQ